MYKLVAIDIDGTLLNNYGEISKKNKEAINYALEKNVQVVLTSGRMPKSIISIANEINANKYLICGNGAAIYDIQKEENIYTNYLSKSKVLEIVDMCEKNNIFYNIYTNNVILSKSLNYNLLFYDNQNKRNPENKKINIKIMENIYKYIENYEGNDFLKINICDDNEITFKNTINKLSKIKNTDMLEIAHTSKKIIRDEDREYEISYFYTEITNENVNKWSAIEKLIEFLNIKQEEVIAIGDNVNDKEMIENSGLGIVTENGLPQMKKIANKIVASNNKSGVAEAIYNNI